MILQFYNQADAFSPPVTQVERTPLDLRIARNGALFVDVVGLGSRNATQLQAALTGDKTDINHVLQGTLRGFNLATDRLMGITQHAQNQAILRLSDSSRNRARVIQSGDDLVAIPQQVLTDEQMGDFVAAAARSPIGNRDPRFQSRVSNYRPAEVRLAFIPPRYGDTGHAIEADLLGEFGGTAHGFEKSMRTHLEAQGVGWDLLQNLTIAIELVPDQLRRGGQVHLFIAGHESIGDQPLRELLDTMRAAAEIVMGPAGFHVVGDIRLPTYSSVRPRPPQPSSNPPLHRESLRAPPPLSNRPPRSNAPLDLARPYTPMPHFSRRPSLMEADETEPSSLIDPPLDPTGSPSFQNSIVPNVRRDTILPPPLAPKTRGR